jgi:hypothetical protein
MLVGRVEPPLDTDEPRGRDCDERQADEDEHAAGVASERSGYALEMRFDLSPVRRFEQDRIPERKREQSFLAASPSAAALEGVAERTADRISPSDMNSARRRYYDLAALVAVSGQRSSFVISSPV